MSSWVTRVPALRDLLGASTGQMGLILLGLAIGSVLGVTCSGAMVARFGARPIIAGGTVAVIVSMPTIGLSGMAGWPFSVAGGLLLFGMGIGAAEVAMNVEGGALERVTGRPFLTFMHAFFSLGTVVGATAGIAFNAWKVSVVTHLVSIGALGVIVLLVCLPYVPRGTGRRGSHEDGRSRTTTARILREPVLLLVGAAVLAMALVEGTANEWLPLVMVDGHGFDVAWGSAIYGVFAASMAVGRFCGGPIVTRFGHAKVICASAMFAALGLITVSIAGQQAVVVGAVICWGLGASLGFPVAISAAAASGPNPGVRVSMVATMGYIAHLVGPPLLGLLGEHFGLRAALLLPAAVALIAGLLAPRISIHRTVRATVSDSHVR